MIVKGKTRTLVLPVTEILLSFLMALISLSNSYNLGHMIDCIHCSLLQMFLSD